MNKLFSLVFIQSPLHDTILRYSLTITQTLTFGCIKWTSDVAFTGSFLDIVFVRYFRQMMGKKICHQKCGMGPLSPVFARQYRPWCQVNSVKNERLECEIKVPLGYNSTFYRHHVQKIYQKLMYPEFFLPRCRCGFAKKKSGSHKLADADPAGTLDSCSGTQNEQKNTQNNVIEVELRTLST